MKNEVQEKKARSSNIELLRVMAILMIIIFHIVRHCVNIQIHGGNETIKIASDLFAKPVFYKKLYLLSGVMKWGPLGNDIFILISGYFMVKKGKNINIIPIAQKLLTQLGFAATTMVIVSNLAVRYYKDRFISAISFNFNTTAWFVGYYFLVIVCAMLFLNEYLSSLSQQRYQVFLVTLFAVIEFNWSYSIFERIGEGLGTVLLGCFLYSFGGYIRTYDPFQNVRGFVFGVIIVCANAIEYIASYNVTATEIQNFDFNDPDAVFSPQVLTFAGRDLVIIAIAVCLFEIFRRISIPNNKIINFLGKGTFMVYLIHDNHFFYSVWGLKNWALELHNTPWLFLADLVKWGGATFIVGIVAYIAYLLIERLLQASKWIYIRSS